VRSARLLVPVRSAWDASQVSESGLDPLGLYMIADRLGVMLVPGVRERQSDPRYLVPICAGAVIAEEVGVDALAADGVSPPWQVYEWYVVEALVRVHGRGERLRGLPGHEKVTAALQRGEPVCARTYLKTPTVFGFHGVYRVLAETLRLIDRDGRLMDRGLDLLQAWEDDTGLHGFVTGAGPGRDFKRRLADAVEAGLAAGRTDRSAGWRGWHEMASHLDPAGAGPAVREALWEILRRSGEIGWRAWLLDLLSSDGGARSRAEGSERSFHERLRGRAPEALGVLLDAISAYERFARLLQDAFEELLYLATRHGRRMHVRALARSEVMERAAVGAPEAFESARVALDGLGVKGLADEFAARFRRVGERSKTQAWVEGLLAHHLEIQERKPPAGRAPWLDRFDDGTVLTRPRYRRDEGARGGGEYVHRYRAKPLLSFCVTLGKVQV